MLIPKIEQEEFVMRTLLQPQRHAMIAGSEDRYETLQEIFPEFRYFEDSIYTKCFLVYVTTHDEVEFPMVPLKWFTLTVDEFLYLISLFGFRCEPDDTPSPQSYGIYYKEDLVGFLGTNFKHT